MIYEGDNVTIIIDPNGLEIIFNNDYNLSYYYENKNLKQSLRLGKIIINNCPEDESDFCDFLESLRFTKY